MPHLICLDLSVIIVVVGKAKPEAIYEDMEDWRSAEANRADPTQVTFTKSGAKRRTSFRRQAMVKDGSDWTDGGRTAWYVVVDANGDTALVSVQTAGELANLPSGALPAQEYCNLIAEEKQSLAADLSQFLAEDAEAHTAHHTSGSDLGARAKTIFAKEQLAPIKYQDSQIGTGITIPGIVRRPRNPASIVGPDGVKW